MSFDKIKLWDDTYCGLHVGFLVNDIARHFNEKNIKEIVLCDIGANVGKVYEMLNNIIPITEAFMFEGSPTIYKYLLDKFIHNNNIIIRNYAITDEPGMLNFDESTINYQFEKNTNYFNLGLSHVSEYGKLRVEGKSFKQLFEEFPNLKNVNCIKIDTENRDFSILKSLLECIDMFIVKPFITFEVNYACNNITAENADNILNEFSLKGYRKISIKDCKGNEALIPL